MRYEVLFGYKSGYEEWLKFESDNYDDSLAFFKTFPTQTNPEKSWYLYIRDNKKEESLDYVEG